MKKIIIAVICLSFINSCQTSGFRAEVSDFISFDRGFIPVYCYCHDNDRANAVKFLKQLDESWKSIIKKYSSQGNDDMLAEINSILQQVSVEIKNGNMDTALGLLTDIKYMLFEYREKKKINYFPDRLILFQETVDNMVLTAGGVRSGKPDNAEIQRIAYELEEANEIFSEAEKLVPDMTVYGFSSEKEKSFKKEMVEIRKYLSALAESVEEKNGRKVLTDVDFLRREYYNLYRMFGNFN